MNFIKNTFFALCLGCVMSLQASEPYHQVQKISLSDTSWTNPSDGSTPTLERWKMQITIEDGHKFELVDAAFQQKVDPRDLFHLGDTIEILEEGYSEETLEFSWFKILNVTSGKNYDFWGLVYKPKPIVEPNTQTISHIKKWKNSEENWELSFFVENLISYIPPFTKIYVKTLVDNEKYHGYYNGMPLKFLKDLGDEADSQGRYRKNLSFFHPITNSEVTLHSTWMGGPSEMNLADVNISTRNLWYHPQTNIAFAYGWTIVLTLDDGDKLILSVDVQSWLSWKRVDEIHNYFRKGDKVKLIEEKNPPSIHYDNFESVYQVHNTRNGVTQVFTGPAKFLNGYDPRYTL